MRLTADESKALGFIALLLALSAAARVIDRPEPIEADLAAVDAGALERASREAQQSGLRSARPLGPGEKIDPNRAAIEELMRLPRVGRALAERIVADRAAHGSYRSLDELDRVSGVGPATLEAWAEHIALPRAAPATARPNARVGARAGDRPPPAGRSPIDINSATATELERVPGIGPALAGRIIAHRNEIGRFDRLEQLVDIPGIGEATLSRIRPYLRVGP